jgi:predicted phage terminase large subunit-like protein
MSRLFEYVIHENGPALWPEHKPLPEVQELKATTPPSIWEGTYQGNPTPPSGTIFMRTWWEGQNRYDHADRSLVNKCIARWQSWDTGLKDDEDDAFTACIEGELLPDYRLMLRTVYRERLQFPSLPNKITQLAKAGNKDRKLRGVLIEDKASGISALQTLKNTAEGWLSDMLIPFMPTADKITRAKQAAVWCNNGCVLLPHPGDSCPWLLDFEDEFFDFPGSPFKDQVDAFSQLILWTENLLAEGWRVRNSVR